MGRHYSHCITTYSGSSFFSGNQPYGEFVADRYFLAELTTTPHLLQETKPVGYQSRPPKVAITDGLQVCDRVRMLDTSAQECAAKEWTCGTCGKQFFRNTHWRRHEATHKDPDRFKCPYCDRGFARSDVYKKHMARCLKKGRGAHKPQLFIPHTPARATLAKTIYNSPSLPLPLPSAPSLGARPVTPTTLKIGPPLSEMTYLIHLLHPSKPTMQHYFNSTNNGGNVNEDAPEIDPTTPQSPPPLQRKKPTLHDLEELKGFFPPSFQSVIDDVVNNDNPDQDFDMLSLTKTSPIPIFSDDGYDILEAMSKSIVFDLHTFHRLLLRTDPGYNGLFDLKEAKTVLSADNLRTFCATFFRLSSIYFPVIHYPTFGTLETSQTLLLGVAITGAFRSTPINHALIARGYGLLVEKYTWHQLDELMTQSSDLSLKGLQLLQSAALIHHRVAMDSLFLKMRMESIPKLLAAVRHFKLTSLQYTPGPDWKDFIYHETCIRVMTAVSIAAWNHSGMMFYPPALSVSEMACNFWGSNDLWNAHDSESYLTRREDLKLTIPPAAIRLTRSAADFIAVLMEDEWIELQGINVNVLSIESLYQATLALMVLSVSTCQMVDFDLAAPKLLRAITRWQQLWNYVTVPLDNNTLLKANLTRHARDYSVLARALLDARIQGLQHPFFDSVGHLTLRALYSFLLYMSTRS